MDFRSGLCLVPTPLSDELPLEPIAIQLLRESWADSLIVVEESKVLRKKWLQWGLPRESIPEFIEFNEHTEQRLAPDILNQLKSGKKAFLFSDGGLPAFCDPGEILIDLCHKHQINVTSTPFENSIILAVALSGWPSSPFIFKGFPPQKEEERKHFWNTLRSEKTTSVLIDAPYRLEKVLREIKTLGRDIFLGLNLNRDSQKLFRGAATQVIKQVEQTIGEEPPKAEFVLIVK